MAYKSLMEHEFSACTLNLRVFEMPLGAGGSERGRLLTQMAPSSPASRAHRERAAATPDAGVCTEEALTQRPTVRNIGPLPGLPEESVNFFTKLQA